jgi:hypothetical protein
MGVESLLCVQCFDCRKPYFAGARVCEVRVTELTECCSPRAYRFI